MCSTDSTDAEGEIMSDKPKKISIQELEKIVREWAKPQNLPEREIAVIIFWTAIVRDDVYVPRKKTEITVGNF